MLYELGNMRVICKTYGWQLPFSSFAVINSKKKKQKITVRLTNRATVITCWLRLLAMAIAMVALPLRSGNVTAHNSLNL